MDPRAHVVFGGRGSDVISGRGTTACGALFARRRGRRGPAAGCAPSGGSVREWQLRPAGRCQPRRARSCPQRTSQLQRSHLRWGVASRNQDCGGAAIPPYSEISPRNDLGGRISDPAVVADIVDYSSATPRLRWSLWSPSRMEFRQAPRHDRLFACPRRLAWQTASAFASAWRGRSSTSGSVTLTDGDFTARSRARSRSPGRYRRATWPDRFRRRLSFEPGWRPSAFPGPARRSTAGSYVATSFLPAAAPCPRCLLT